MYREDGLGSERADSAEIDCSEIGDAAETSSKGRRNSSACVKGVGARVERNSDFQHARPSDATDNLLEMRGLGPEPKIHHLSSPIGEEQGYAIVLNLRRMGYHPESVRTRLKLLGVMQRARLKKRIADFD